MNCQHVIEQLGPYLDGEIPADVRATVSAHLSDCKNCQAELDSLRSLADRLAAPVEAAVPGELWTAIGQRLEAAPPLALRTGKRVLVRHWVRRWPGAIAASILLAVGIGVSQMTWDVPTAQASTIDFGVLLDALPVDANLAFDKFLNQYGAQESSLAAAREHAPTLSFELPEALPRGFRRETIYALQFGGHPGVAARYRRGDELLAVIFHPAVGKESFGKHQDRRCLVGRHNAHKVEVAGWKLVHLSTPQTCQCVLSRLDDNTELPQILAATAPRCQCGCGMAPPG